MRFMTYLIILLASGPALAHGTHLLPVDGHDHGAGLVALVLIAGLAAWLVKRTITARTGKDD